MTDIHDLSKGAQKIINAANAAKCSNGDIEKAISHTVANLCGVTMSGGDIVAVEALKEAVGFLIKNHKVSR